jgi:hypothetical protein
MGPSTRCQPSSTIWRRPAVYYYLNPIDTGTKAHVDLDGSGCSPRGVGDCRLARVVTRRPPIDVAPQALIDELGLEGLSPSPRHPDLVQTKVMALNSDLTPKSGSLDPVRDTFVDMDAHLALMEMNVSLTFEFIFRELLNSNLSEIRKLPEGQGHIEQFNSFLAEQRAYMNVLREIFSAYGATIADRLNKSRP